MSYRAMSCPDNVPTILELVAEIAPSVIVDIGCGSGDYGVLLREHYPRAAIIGIEAHMDCDNDQWLAYDRVIMRDVRTTPLPPADLYLLIDVIEHLSRAEGLLLLSRIHGPAVICTPRHWPQDADENPFQAHVSEWHESDFDFSRDRSDAAFVIGVAGG